MILLRYSRRLLQLETPILKCIHKISSQAAKRHFKEVEIKVPWGKIAGKHWGPTDVEPIIAVHGWQDNAASFDPLAEYLPENLSVLAIDFPGHGLSSWLPNGIMYNILGFVQVLHRVKEHYGLEKMGLIGHSMGGIVSFNYASLFPDNVKFAVCFDYYKHPTLDEKTYFKMFRRDWNDFFKFENMTKLPPSYTEAEIIQRWMEATRNSVDEEQCKLLMTRGTAKKPDGSLYFSRDPRVKSFAINNGYTDDHIRILIQQISCPYMVLRGESGQIKNETDESYYKNMDLFKQCSKDFHFHIVPGTHHFHMGNPDKVAQLINPFIRQYSN